MKRRKNCVKMQITWQGNNTTVISLTAKQIRYHDQTYLNVQSSFSQVLWYQFDYKQIDTFFNSKRFLLTSKLFYYYIPYRSNMKPIMCRQEEVFSTEIRIWFLSIQKIFHLTFWHKNLLKITSSKECNKEVFWLRKFSWLCVISESNF